MVAVSLTVKAFDKRKGLAASQLLRSGTGGRQMDRIYAILSLVIVASARNRTLATAG